MKLIKENWWKVLAIMLLLYAIFMGFMGTVPDLPVVQQTIRNIYFHVGMWFSMMFVLGISVFYSIRYLLTNNPEYDLKAKDGATIGIVLGCLGLLTGMIWAKNTWGHYWIQDPKLNGAAVSMLAYLAYMVLRSSIDQADKRARLSGVYNIFAFVIMFVFIMLIPRMAEASIHPGMDGNPALASGDLDSRMRLVFFPAMAGWVLLSYWIWKVYSNINRIEENISNLLEEKE